MQQVMHRNLRLAAANEAKSYDVCMQKLNKI